jgi:glycosyltransferase 2 family protein
LDQLSKTPRSAKVRHWIIAVLLAAVCLYFSLRGIHWRDVWQTISNANVPFILLTILFGTVALLARALRWNVLLSSRAAVPFATAFWATSAGYFGNNYLPARAGELIRTFYISSRTGLPNFFVLATALSERLSDAVTLVLISSLILLTMPYRPGWFADAAKPFAVIGVAGALSIILLPLLEGLWRNILFRLPLPHNVRDRLLRILEHVLSGLRALHDWGRLLRFSALALGIWFLDALSTVVLMRSLGMHANIPLALLLITSLALASALPATPGYVGIYQFVAVSVLVPFGFKRADAIAYILLAQALNYFGTGLWGLLAFSQARVPNWRTLTGSAERIIV